MLAEHKIGTAYEGFMQQVNEPNIHIFIFPMPVPYEMSDSNSEIPSTVFHTSRVFATNLIYFYGSH